MFDECTVACDHLAVAEIENIGWELGVGRPSSLGLGLFGFQGGAMGTWLGSGRSTRPILILARVEGLYEHAHTSGRSCGSYCDVTGRTR